jgi:hypothetical protein
MVGRWPDASFKREPTEELEILKILKLDFGLLLPTFERVLLTFRFRGKLNRLSEKRSVSAPMIATVLLPSCLSLSNLSWTCIRFYSGTVD